MKVYDFIKKEIDNSLNFIVQGNVLLYDFINNIRG